MGAHMAFAWAFAGALAGAFAWAFAWTLYANMLVAWAHTHGTRMGTHMAFVWCRTRDIRTVSHTRH